MKVFTSLRKLRVFAALTALAVMLSIAGSMARADAILFDPDGGGVNPTFNVGSFGFETGNALAQAVAPGGTILGVGSTFQLFFQTRLSNLTITPGGSTVTPAGLNGSAGGPAFEITLTASVTERIVSVGAGTATFETNPVQSAGSFFRMWQHTSLTSDNFTGTGFTTGAGPLILAGVPSSSLPSSGNFTVNSGTTSPFDQFDPTTSVPGLFYAGKTSLSGSGGTVIGGTVTSFDPNFFKTPVTAVRFDAFNNIPFVATTPSQAFNNSTNAPVVLANFGTTDGVSGPDFQFQSRTSAVFTAAAIPEPASVGMMAVGIVGVLGYSWRKRRQSA